MNIIKALPPKFPDNTYIGVDSEWLGLNSKQLHRPTSGKFACLTVCPASDPDTVYFIDKDEDVQSALNIIDNCVWIMQNAKFDIVQLRRHAIIKPRNKLIDIMLMEKILFGGYFNFFSLKALARRYLDLIIDKETRELFENATELSPDMIEYACRDAQLNVLIWDKQKKQITKSDMKIWKEIDAPAMWAFADFIGFRFDKVAWDELAERNTQRQKDIDAELPFNPRSPQQVLPYLRKRGFPKLKNTQAKSLEDAILKHPGTEAVKLAEQIQESRKYGTRKSRYGKNFAKTYAEKEKDYWVIVTNYNTTQAETGRTSSDDPAMQNIIARDTSEFRDCFIARPGHKLVIADYDAQEARISAYLTKDPRLIEIFKSGEKVYIVAGREIFGKDVKKGSPEYSQIKSTFLGTDYGMSEFGLARREHITVEEAKEIIEKFFKVFPNVKKWIDKQQKNKKVVYTVAGRKIHLNPYSGQCERNAINAPHQGTAADMAKKALGIIHRTWGFPFLFCAVEFSHDELGFDVPEEYAEDVAKVVKYVMEQVGNEMCSPIPFKADVVICDKWSEKG